MDILRHFVEIYLKMTRLCCFNQNNAISHPLAAAATTTTTNRTTKALNVHKNVKLVTVVVKMNADTFPANKTVDLPSNRCNFKHSHSHT